MSLHQEGRDPCSNVPAQSLPNRSARSTSEPKGRTRASAGKLGSPSPRPDEPRTGARPSTGCASERACDGRLALWQDLASQRAWSDLLVGNGFSSHIWPGFAYRSLYERACRAGMLTGSDQELFQANTTENFESVLAALAISIRTLETLGDPAADRLRGRYLRIQRSLGAAVRGVHLPLGALPASTREAVRSTLRDYRWVFSTCYDLVLYWCAGHGESFDGFADFFFCNKRLEFDPTKTSIPPDTTRLVYLHGALHLLVDRNGVVRKRRSHAATLLEQFGEPDPTDTLTRPLLVAEGTAAEKSRIISRNDYLSFAVNQLRRSTRGLVIFGLSLREEDTHLVRALNFRAKRPIAVAIRPRTRSENRRRQSHIRALLDTDDISFFDATTHPLGHPELTPAPPGDVITAGSYSHTQQGQPHAEGVRCLHRAGRT
jgi:uncharacterized protein DUF4917